MKHETMPLLPTPLLYIIHLYAVTFSNRFYLIAFFIYAKIYYKKNLTKCLEKRSYIYIVYIYLIRKRWEFLGHILRMDEETPANKAMRIFYAKKIPEDEATRQEANRIRPSGRPFKNLPNILKEEFKELTVEDRFTLTRIGTKSIDELSNQEELSHLRNLARQGQHQEEHGAKWKKLVDKIVEANTKKWVSREAKH